MVEFAFNLSPQEAGQKDLCEFKASLVYIANSRLPRTTQRDPASKTKRQT